ncbi:hypothetical protein R3P38DRAFT_3045998 [Favolaschia claudopus]|uniref:Secreted protein n=1 Tax=Favolaschia claudopus TaxID=2862362 RepID=A0AAW0A737_9AGAR
MPTFSLTHISGLIRLVSTAVGWFWSAPRRGRVVGMRWLDFGGGRNWASRARSDGVERSCSAIKQCIASFL